MIDSDLVTYFIYFGLGHFCQCTVYFANYFEFYHRVFCHVVLQMHCLFCHPVFYVGYFPSNVYRIKYFAFKLFFYFIAPVNF